MVTESKIYTKKNLVGIETIQKEFKRMVLHNPQGQHNIKEHMLLTRRKKLVPLILLLICCWCGRVLYGPSKP